ncbi:MAG: hypothetical protein K0S23_2066 [Fluviicola sp.]|jgi:hypothetical protein|uniref:hypothetical protein n=1 Tax=Fluviicola sp. TaxID=1917219 RepID=UPI00262F4128|nr:hypothetical protein [Fluviicola sp.]MDF3027759.1 hypothetical protein [Fluviicola sp.]
MKHLIALCFLLTHLSLLSQNDSTRFVIRTYGFQSWDDYDIAIDSVAKNWNLVYLPVSGCLVTDEFIDSIEQLNNKTYLKLEAQYGSDWKERFDKEVDAAYSNLLYRKETTYRETANCITEYCSFKAFENFSRTGMKFIISIKKEGAVNHNDIHITGLQHIDSTILYRGYNNLIALEYGTFAKTDTISIKSKGELYLADSCLASNQIQLRYRAPGSVKYDTLLVETADGQVQRYIFNLKNLSPPALYFEEELLDSTLRISDLNKESVLSMHYEKPCLVPDRFTIHSWEIWYSGSKGHYGGGSIIPISVIRKLKKLKPGTKCSILITVSNPDSILRKKIIHFTLI